MLKKVVGLSRIELQVVDKIEQGSSVELGIQMFDTLDRAFDWKAVSYVALDVVVGSASVVRVTSIENGSYWLDGIQLGETTVTVVAGDVRSAAIIVQVFAPLKLSPRNVTLLIGATLQVVRTYKPYKPFKTMSNTCIDTGMINCCLLFRSVPVDLRRTR